MITLEPVGVVVGGRAEPIDDDWGGIEARIRMDAARFGPDAVEGLSAFSHLVVVFQFHLSARVNRGAAHPRGNPAWPRVGVLAGHSPTRPNHIGVSRCELISVDALELTVRGLDAIDGSPVLDVKPYATEFNPAGPVREPDWMRELMRQYY